MRTLPQDIKQELTLRFGSEYPKALKLLTDYINANTYLDADRIIRCIIFLSDNTIESFTSCLKAAKGDPRDVMWWAEYDPKDGMAKNKRLYDFSKPFKNNKI